MGEKQGGKGDDGEKKKAEAGGEKKKAEAAGGEKKKADAAGGEKKKDEGGKGKKDDGPITVVLKVDMHCEGCARKVRHAIKGFEGVESVSTDCPGNKLTVVGKVDPWTIRDRVESKTHKTVVLISPNVPKKEKTEEKKGADEKGDKKTDDKKPKTPEKIVLKVRFHCEGCVQRIQKIIQKVKGVDSVVISREEEKVTVEGTMDKKALLEYLKQKVKRNVDEVPAKKGGGGGGEKKEGGGGGGGEEKKKEDGGGGEKKEGGGAAKAVAEVNKMEFHGLGGFGAYVPPPPYGYNVNTFHAPQYFSDENPNACSVM